MKHKDVVHNSRYLWFLALDCWVDDIDKGTAAATDHLEYIYDTEIWIYLDHRDQQEVQRLLGRQQIRSVPLPDSLMRVNDSIDGFNYQHST